MDFNSLTEHSRVLLDRFKCLLPRGLEVDSILKALPRRKIEGKVLLDIGMPSPVMSALLREHGGAWASLARSPENAAEASGFLGVEVACLGAGGEVPFEQHSFDVVVVSLGILVAMENPEFFIKECHRVLKTSGELIISTQYKKSFSIVNLMRRRAATGRDALISRAYTERGLFSFLKNGFDVMGEDFYSGFFVELVRIREYRLTMAGVDEAEICKDLCWRYNLADQLDRFTFWSKGFVILVHAKRHQWRERTVPVLADGRKIQEAVLTHG